MNAVSVPGGLPRGVRNVCVATLIVSAAVGLRSAADVLGMNFARPKTTDALQEKAREAEATAVEGMQLPRGLTLSALSLTCALTFVSAGRILGPRGLPREGSRKLLVMSSIAAALIRSIDGAESAVIARRMGLAVGKAMVEMPSLANMKPEDVERMVPSLMTGFSVVQTLLAAGAFAAASQYFRSQRVRKVLAAADQQPPPRSP